MYGICTGFLVEKLREIKNKGNSVIILSELLYKAQLWLEHSKRVPSCHHINKSISKLMKGKIPKSLSKFLSKNIV